MAKWRSDRSSSTLSSQVSTDQQQAETNNFTSTPTLVVAGPKGQAAPLVGDVDYNTVESTIKSTQ
jgi:protein-disulfide isomerase